MPIPLRVAELAVSAVTGAVKLGVRLDQIFAEEQALKSGLLIRFPEVVEVPTVSERKTALRGLLQDTEGQTPDPLGSDRNKIKRLLNESNVGTKLWNLCKKYGLTDFGLETFKPDEATQKLLAARRVSWDLEDEDIQRLTWFIAAGPERRESSLAFRIAATTLDVVAETAAMNTRFLVERESTRRILETVLVRFSKPDLAQMSDWSRVLRHSLSSTIEGVIDAREHVAKGEPWLRHALSAIARARDAAPGRDDFVLGLFRGEGFKQLVRGLLEEGASVFAADETDLFESMLAAVLDEAAKHVEAAPHFGAFFDDSWHHLLGAALGSLEEQGPRLLAGSKPILRETLVAAVGALSDSLSQGPPNEETLVVAIEAAIGAVAENPDVLEGTVREAWLRDLIGSLAFATREAGLREAFSRDALESYLRASLAAVGRHPHIIAGDGELASALVGRVLTGLSEVEGFGIEPIADAVVVSSFEAIAENGALISNQFPDLVSELAAGVATMVGERHLSGLEGAEVLEMVISTVASNEQVFVAAQSGLAATLVRAVVDGSRVDDTRLIVGTSLMATMRELFDLAGRNGLEWMDELGLQPLGESIEAIVAGSLDLATEELGHRLGTQDLPVLVSRVIQTWASDDPRAFDPEAPEFAELIEQIVTDLNGPAVNERGAA